MNPTNTKQSPRPTPAPSQTRFRTLVLNASRHGDRDGEPRLPKSTIFHWLRKLGLWEDLAKPIRQKYSDRLCLSGERKPMANLKSWRMLEDAIYVSEDRDGVMDVEKLRAELESLRAYAKGTSYPESPSPDGIASAIADVKKLFGDIFVWKSYLPLTIMHHYKRLGMWNDAAAHWQINVRAFSAQGNLPQYAAALAWLRLSNDLGWFFYECSDLSKLRKHIGGAGLLAQEIGPSVTALEMDVEDSIVFLWHLLARSDSAEDSASDSSE